MEEREKEGWGGVCQLDGVEWCGRERRGGVGWGGGGGGAVGELLWKDVKEREGGVAGEY